MSAMNVAAGIAILPHFDRMRSIVGDEAFARITASAPAGITLIGVDEDTALVRIDDTWRVSGRQSMTVFDGTAQRVIRPGEMVVL
jgi:cyanophycinase-like exopeptidase